MAEPEICYLNRNMACGTQVITCILMSTNIHSLSYVYLYLPLNHTLKHELYEKHTIPVIKTYFDLYYQKFSTKVFGYKVF